MSVQDSFFQYSLLSLPEPIIIVDNDHIVQFVNPAAIRLFEIAKPSSVVGKSFVEIPGGKGLKTFKQRVEHTEKTNKYVTNQTPISQPEDEQIWIGGSKGRLYHYRATAIQEEAGKIIGYVIKVYEITNEITARELLIGLLAEMIVPAQTIFGFADILLQENPPRSLTEEQREELIIIRDQSKRLIELREKFFTEVRTLYL